MMRLRLGLGTAGLVLTGALLLAACGGGEASTPTPRSTAVATATRPPVATSTRPAATATPTRAAATATRPPAATPTRPPSTGAGNPGRGAQVFTAKGCTACHTTTSATLVGPGLAGIGSRAGMRKPDMSARDYIVESLSKPNAFIVPPFPSGLMPDLWSGMTVQEREDLVAYLLSLQ